MLCLDDAQLAALLREDAPLGDLTTDALGIGRRMGSMVFRARGAMVAACVEEAARMVELAGAKVHLAATSGQALAAGALILEAEGSAERLHRAWKIAQTLVEYTSGIASAAAEIVAASGGVPVACTRKNFPGSRALSVKAVLSGGAAMHRLGLSESVLVFPEHRAFLKEGLAEAVSRIRRAAPEQKVRVEAATVEDAQEAARAGADVVQLEKFEPAAVADYVSWLGREGLAPVVAAAGGVNAKNAGAYVAAGAQVLVTSAPFSAKPRDVAVTIISL